MSDIQDIDTWRQTHLHLSLAIAQSRDNISKQLAIRRYLLEEITRCKALTPTTTKKSDSKVRKKQPAAKKDDEGAKPKVPKAEAKSDESKKAATKKASDEIKKSTVKKPSEDLKKGTVRKANEDLKKGSVKKASIEAKKVVVKKTGDEAKKATVRKPSDEIKKITVKKTIDEIKKVTVKKSSDELKRGTIKHAPHKKAFLSKAKFDTKVNAKVITAKPIVVKPAQSSKPMPKPNSKPNPISSETAKTLISMAQAIGNGTMPEMGMNLKTVIDPGKKSEDHQKTSFELPEK